MYILKPFLHNKILRQFHVSYDYDVYSINRPHSVFWKLNENFEQVEVYIYDLDFNLLDIVQWQPLACQVF
jgi:hypothetical protein